VNGIFAEIAVNDSVLVAHDSQSAFFGKPVQLIDFLVKQSVSNPAASPAA